MNEMRLPIGRWFLVAFDPGTYQATVANPQTEQRIEGYLEVSPRWGTVAFVPGQPDTPAPE
jgi:hypothetical protein